MKFSLLVTFLLLSVLCHAEGLPDLGEYSQTLLSPQEEMRIGEQIIHDIRESGTMVDDVEVADYLAALGYRLATNSSDNRQVFTFFVIQDRTINAFALPGGFIGVHTGLIQIARSESELASVLAHEIGHVVQRHIARQVAEQQRSTIPSVAALALAILVARANPQAGQAGLAAVQAGTVQRQLDFTRENEREADRVGLQILDKSGFDTRAMPAFFEQLMKGTRFVDGAAPSFLRTHPLTTERISEVTNRAEQLPYRQVPDSLEFQMVRAKLRAMQGSTAEAIQYFEEAEQQGRFANPIAAQYGLALALMRGAEFDRAQQVVEKLQVGHAAHPMIETLAGNLMVSQGKTQAALNALKKALNVFPRHRGLVYAYAEALIQIGKYDDAIQFLTDKEQIFSMDSHLYELQSQAYTHLGKTLMRHQAQGEAYYRNFDLAAAAEQMELAVKSGEGDFYQLSMVEARLKEIRQQLDDVKKK